MYPARSCTTHDKIASLPTGAVELAIGSLKFGSKMRKKNLSITFQYFPLRQKHDQINVRYIIILWLYIICANGVLKNKDDNDMKVQLAEKRKTDKKRAEVKGNIKFIKSNI